MTKKRLTAVLLVLMLWVNILPAGAAQTREITDMAGRTVNVPQRIDSVFSVNPVAAIYLYTVAPEKLLGWNYALTDAEKAYILPSCHDLPSFGVQSAVNYEAVIMAGPSVALSVGKINEAMRDEADQLADKLGIPVVCLDEDMSSIPAAYRLLGTLLGEEERAETLARYAEETLDAIAVMEIHEDQRVRLYYGNGEDSLETAPAGSTHSQIIEWVGAVNAARLELGDGYRIQISPEQLLAWNPDAILLTGEPQAGLSGNSAAEEFKANPLYATLKAVEDDKVYGAPSLPFGWLDRPPGPNRLLGLRWLSGLLYPDCFDRNVQETVKEFFKLFYHMDLTQDQLLNLGIG